MPQQDTQNVSKTHSYHEPVLLAEVTDLLVCNADGVYIDGTLGGGGHAAAILRKLGTKGRLIAFDADERAIGFCRGAFADELARGSESRIRLVHANYSEACTHEEVTKHRSSLSGLLLDLGVSSHQLDNPAQGISHRYDAALDMRFGGSGPTAADIVNKATELELERILKEYGEEKFARKITKAIVGRRRIAPIATTAELRKAVEDSVSPPLFASALARVFQALRIAVNHELEVLEQTLQCIIPLLAKGGRIAVISYHSLEDRIVKNIFRAQSKGLTASYPGERSIEPTLKIINKKPIEASSEEQQRNPRSRSAKLRVVEKV